MRVYCTLFDSNYLSRGLVCYESLKAQTSVFLLYVFAFDDLTFDILTKMNLPDLKVISLKEFEDVDLLRVKSSRSRVEYCWTCTPSTVLYVLKNYGHDHCTYIDADLFFYKDPSILLDAMKENSVLITPHFYTPEYDQSKTSGIYCVQFISFRNNAEGLRVLEWWRNACLAWCYDRMEDGKFGDQKYLDDWPTRFSGIYVSENKGEGVAPWNIQSWSESEVSKIVFYHFHALKNFGHYYYKGAYRFPEWTDYHLYQTYVTTLENIEDKLSSNYQEYRPKALKLKIGTILRHIKELLKIKHNFIMTKS